MATNRTTSFPADLKKYLIDHPLTTSWLSTLSVLITCLIVTVFSERWLAIVIQLVLLAVAVMATLDIAATEHRVKRNNHNDSTGP